jgi:hypothetical protein
MSFLRYFVFIVNGALASSAIGRHLCLRRRAGVAGVCEFPLRAKHRRFTRPLRRGSRDDLGDFPGTAAMAFSLLFVTLIHIARVIKKKNDTQTLP